MGIEQLVLKMISLVLAMTIWDNGVLVEEIDALQTELMDIAISIADDGPDPSELDYHDNAWFAGNVLVCYPEENEAATYTIPEGTIAVMPMAFCNNSHIRRVVCPDSLVYIGQEAFAQTPLSGIDLEHVLMIGGSAFEGTALSAITLSDKIVWLDSFAFFGARIKRTTHVTLPATLMYIGEDIIVSGTSSRDTYGPFYEVVEGSYAHRWAKEYGWEYKVTDPK